jgi:hypothetical protein
VRAERPLVRKNSLTAAYKRIRLIIEPVERKMWQYGSKNGQATVTSLGTDRSGGYLALDSSHGIDLSSAEARMGGSHGGIWHGFQAALSMNSIVASMEGLGINSTQDFTIMSPATMDSTTISSLV